MAKDKRARELGQITLAALGIVMGSILDTMRAAEVPNDLAHVFLDRLESGFGQVLYGDAYEIMADLVDVLRSNVPGND